ncbi:MAG: hypothetical protein LBQ59_02325 [Candidatus Peribacteria bacterium]|nr:hypothetical protein [Candidatus Peribacteria bacterium]
MLLFSVNSFQLSTFNFQLNSILSTFPVIGISSKIRFLPLKEYSSNKGISAFFEYSS